MKPIINLVKEILERTKSFGRGAPPHWMDGARIYKHREPETPLSRYVRDLRAINRTIFTWQCFSAFAIVTGGCLGYGWYQQAQKSQVERYYVRVDEFGEVSQTFIKATMNASSEQFLAAAKAFVINAFSRSALDPGVNKQRYNDLTIMISGPAVAKWNDWSKRTEGTADSREIEFLSWKPLSSEDNQVMTWNVVWRETETKDGIRKTAQRRNGDFTIEHRQPKKESELFGNPLRMFIIDMKIGPEQGM